MNVARLRTFFYAFLVTQALALVQSAEAKTFDCDAGNVQCLVSAISQANADPHQKTTIRLAGGTYALTDVDNDTDGPNGLPSIVSDVTIKGAQDGAILTRLAGALGFRILHVGASGRLTLQGVTITNPFDFASFITDPASGLFNNGGVVTVVDSSFIDNSIGDVGALYNNDGTVRIIDSTFSGSFGFNGAGIVSAGGVVDVTRTVFDQHNGFFAGALWSMDAEVHIVDSRFSSNSSHFAGAIRVSGGTTSITRTTFVGNTGDPSGGIFVDSQGTVTVRDSAFVENVGLGGAGIFNNGGNTHVTNTTFAQNVTFFSPGTVLNVNGTVTLINSTFAENTAPGGTGTAVASSSGAITLLQNTIVVHNGSDPSALCTGVVTSLGHNLIGDSSCIVAPQQGDVIGQVDAGLGQLVDDGTPGNAHYLLISDSPAIDAANDAVCPKKDQLGRPRAPRCDIGAIEFRRTDVTLATE